MEDRERYNPILPSSWLDKTEAPFSNGIAGLTLLKSLMDDAFVAENFHANIPFLTRRKKHSAPPASNLPQPADAAAPALAVAAADASQAGSAAAGSDASASSSSDTESVSHDQELTLDLPHVAPILGLSLKDRASRLTLSDQWIADIASYSLENSSFGWFSQSVVRIIIMIIIILILHLIVL